MITWSTREMKFDTKNGLMMRRVRHRCGQRRGLRYGEVGERNSCLLYDILAVEANLERCSL
jgi:hypothetical protein